MPTMQQQAGEPMTEPIGSLWGLPVYVSDLVPDVYLVRYPDAIGEPFVAVAKATIDAMCPPEYRVETEGDGH